jgi:hypothetical protein
MVVGMTHRSTANVRAARYPGASHHARPGALRYLWSHPYGRLTLLLLVVAALGLTAHYWAPILLVAALPRYR